MPLLPPPHERTTPLPSPPPATPSALPAPGEPALRQSFDPDADDFVSEGLQDVDATLMCRIPQPVRVRAADPTNTV